MANLSNGLGWIHIAVFAFSTMTVMFGLLTGLVGYIWRKQGEEMKEVKQELRKLNSAVHKHMVESGQMITHADCANCTSVTAICRKIDDLQVRRRDRWAEQNKENDNLWDAVNRHTHEGISGSGGVIRSKS